MLILAAATLLLHAAPSGPGTLTVEIKPASSVLFVDGKKRGDGSKPIVLKLPAGKHQLRVTHKGDAQNDEIVIKAGEKSTWKWEFEGPPEDAKPEEKPAEKKE